MQEPRQRHRTLLLLALILGILGMHALVMPPMAMTVGTTMPAQTGPFTAEAAPDVMTTSPVGPSSPRDATEAGATAEGQHASVAHASAAGDGDSAPPSPMSGHDMQHLCLAVLAAVLALALVAALLAPVARPADPTRRGPGVRTAPRRPPPDQAVRLAELCVLRN